MWNPTLDPNKPAYRSLLDALAEDVRSGELVTGTKLPTHRDLARSLGVAIGTVTRAYSLAERTGLVHGEVGRGTFVGNPAEEPVAGDLRESINGAVNLSMTWPLTSLDPDLGTALKKLSQDPNVNSLLTYQPNVGNDRHRQAGVRWLERYGLHVPAARVAVCAGSQHALTVVLGSLMAPGDTVLCESLTYPGMRASAHFTNVHVQGLSCDEEGLDPDAFERACRKGRGRALYTTPTYQNPTVATLSLERRRAIAASAQRHGVYIIEDAIHHLLHPSPPPTIASLAPEQTIFIGSPSKVVAGGLRIAFLAAPTALMARIAKALWATTWMVSPLCGEIFTRWIDDGNADKTTAAKRTEAMARVALAREVLTGLPVAFGDGAYHAWLPLRPPYTSAQSFVDEAAQRGVLTTGMGAFCVGTGTAPTGVRFSLSTPNSRDQLRVGLERVAAAWTEGPGLGDVVI